MRAATFPVRNGNNVVIVPARVVSAYDRAPSGLLGATGARPSTPPAMTPFYDTTLQETVYFKGGSTWTDHMGVTR